MHSFLNKGTVGNYLIRLHEICVTHTKFLNKLHKLLVLLSLPYMEYIIRSILKDVNDIAKVIGPKGSGTLDELRFYQDFITAICDILPRKILEFDTLCVVQIFHQRSIIIGKNGNHCGDIDLGSGCFWRHQFQELLNNIRWQSAPGVCSLPCQVLNHVFIYLISSMKTLYMFLHSPREI